MSAYPTWIDAATGNATRPTFRGSFADESPVTPEDHGSTEPQEDDMAPSGTTVETMTRMARAAQARLAALAPAGGRPYVMYEFKMYGSGDVQAQWVAAVTVDCQVVAMGTADTLDAAVLQCVAKLVDRVPATAGAVEAGMNRVLEAVA